MKRLSLIAPIFLSACVATNPPIADDKKVSDAPSIPAVKQSQKPETRTQQSQKQESPVLEKKVFEKGTISEVFTNYDNYLGKEGYIGMAKIKFSGMTRHGGLDKLGGSGNDPFFKKKIWDEVEAHYSQKPTQVPLPKVVSADVSFVLERAKYDLKKQSVMAYVRNDEMRQIAKEWSNPTYYVLPVQDTSILNKGGRSFGSIKFEPAIEQYEIKIPMSEAEKMFSSERTLYVSGKVFYELEQPRAISSDGFGGGASYFWIRGRAKSAYLVLNGKKIDAPVSTYGGRF